MTFLGIQVAPSSSGATAAVAILGGAALVLLPMLGAPIRRATAERGEVSDGSDARP